MTMLREHSKDAKSTQTGRYLYAVVPAEKAEKLTLKTPGIEEGEVYPLLAGKMAAIVSDLEPEPLRPQRKHLAAHQGVLRSLMEETTLLPVAFGIIAGSEEEVRELLASHEEAFVRQLGELEGQVEMGLRCRVNVPNAFAYFVEAAPELREMRDELFSAGEPSREQKIELGKKFQEVLDGARQETAGAVQEGLECVATRTRVNDPRNETELLNMAVLVPRAQLDAFNEAVKQTASQLDDAYELAVTGPWPAYNFVDLRIHIEEPQAQEAH